MTRYLTIPKGRTIIDVLDALRDSHLKPVKDDQGNVSFVEEAKDSGGEWMTVTELAKFLQKPVSAVREMCKSRAQKGLHPLPFVRINGKGVRFNRAKITKWLEEMPERHSRPHPRRKAAK